MNNAYFARLTDRAVVRVHGAEAAHFLQGLVTNDVEHMTAPQQSCHAALLTPQGKILFDFFINKRGDEFYLDCPANLANDLLKRLTFYKLRAKVEVSDASSEFVVAALWGAGLSARDPENAIYLPDPRLDALGYRLLAHPDDMTVLAEGFGCDMADAEDYHAHRIALGVPEGGKDYAYGDTFPHEACLDQLGGLDFRKGCYVGQEVVSRMQHRGTARKRIVPVVGDAVLPERGTEVVAGTIPIGILGSHAGRMGLAMLRLDRLEKAYGKGDTPTAAGVSLTPRQPEWAAFEVPKPSAVDA